MNPVPENLSLSETIEFARQEMSDVRRLLNAAIRKHGWRDRIEHVSGLLTCGLVALHSSNEEIIKSEISHEDEERGPHIAFSPRGVGLDICPCCFVCAATERAAGANHYMNNIAAFVKSKEAGEKVVEWLGGKGRVDFRPSEPNWIQVKIGSCDLHKPNLEALYKATVRYGVIRQKDITEALNN